MGNYCYCNARCPSAEANLQDILFSNLDIQEERSQYTDRPSTLQMEFTLEKELSSQNPTN